MFEGRFRHVHVDREEYLIHLVRYIHLNPVKAGIVDKPEDYMFSNYLEWIGKRGGEIVDRNFIKCYFNDSTEYEKFVCEYQYNKEMEEKLDKYLFD